MLNSKLKSLRTILIANCCGLSVRMHVCHNLQTRVIVWRAVGSISFVANGTTVHFFRSDTRAIMFRRGKKGPGPGSTPSAPPTLGSGPPVQPTGTTNVIPPSRAPTSTEIPTRIQDIPKPAAKPEPVAQPAAPAAKPSAPVTQPTPMVAAAGAAAAPPDPVHQSSPVPGRWDLSYRPCQVIRA